MLAGNAGGLLRGAGYALAGSILVVTAVYGVLGSPLITAASVGVLLLVACLLLVSPARVADVAFVVGLSATLLVPASQFSGFTRVAISVVPAAIMLIGWLRSPQRPRLRHVAWVVPVWLFLLALGVTASEDLAKYIGYTALALSGLLLASRTSRAVITGTLVSMTAIQVALGMAEVFLGLRMPWPESATSNIVRLNDVLGASVYRAEGTLGHPLVLSFLIAVAFALVLRADLRTRVRVPLLLWFAAGMLMTGSRSGVLLLVGLLLVSARRRFSLVQAAVGLVALVVTVLVAINVGFFSSDLVTRLLGSGSVYHRTASLASFNSLFSLGGRETLIGGGFGGVGKAQAQGLLLANNFQAVDNQFVSLMATVGLIGLACFVALLAVTLKIAPTTTRWAIAGAVSMFFIFDVLEWPSATLVLLTLVGSALARPAEHSTSDTPATPVAYRASVAG